MKTLALCGVLQPYTFAAATMALSCGSANPLASHDAPATTFVVRKYGTGKPKQTTTMKVAELPQGIPELGTTGADIWSDSELRCVALQNHEKRPMVDCYGDKAKFQIVIDCRIHAGETNLVKAYAAGSEDGLNMEMWCE